MTGITAFVASSRAGLRQVQAALAAGRVSADDIAAAEALRADLARLPPLPKGDTAAGQEWIDNRAELRSCIAKRDPRFFLHWPVVVKTMAVWSGYPYLRDAELPAVRSAGWLPLLSEDTFGSPRLISGTSTSGNLLHHGYHLLRFEQATGRAAASYGEAVEIGGGYGSMARLLYRLSHGRIALTLLDLPEFSALQRYFLGRLGIDARLVQSSTRIVSDEPAVGGRLLIATWSLSEIPVADRDHILKDAGQFDAYLIGYQHRFHEADNPAYFRDLAKRLSPDVDWVLDEKIAHMPGQHCYLFGVRR